MAGPLKIKASQTAPLSHQLFVGLIFGIPVFYLAYLWGKHRELHFDDPRLNLAAHALLLILPVVWVLWLNRTEMQFVESPGEFLAFAGSWRSRWKWALLYQSLALGIVFTAHAAWQTLRGSVAPPSTSVPAAIVTLLLVFWFTFVVREKTRIWIVEDGLRVGLTRFVPWRDIDHVGWHGRVVEIFHKQNPHVPTASASIHDDRAVDLLKQCLVKNGVPESAETSAKLIVTMVTAIGLAAVIFCCGLVAHYGRGIDGRWVVLSSMIVGGCAMWLLEKTYTPASTRVGRPIIIKQAN